MILINIDYYPVSLINAKSFIKKREITGEIKATVKISLSCRKMSFANIFLFEWNLIKLEEPGNHVNFNKCLVDLFIDSLSLFLLVFFFFFHLELLTESVLVFAYQIFQRLFLILTRGSRTILLKQSTFRNCSENHSSC